MSSRNEQKPQAVPISTEGQVGESRRVIKGIENPLTDLEGTANQVSVTPVGDKVVLSTPQNIDKNADVEFDSLTLDDLTALRLVYSDASKKLVSVASLSAWILGTTNQVTVTNNGDGTVTLSTPQDIDTDANVIFGSVTQDYAAFSTTAGISPTEAQLAWNADDGTLDLGLPGGNVVLQIGQEVHAPRARAIGSNINNGDLVYVSGATGAIPEMSLAKADAAATSTGTIAMATEDVTQNQLGYFTAFGLVRGIDTSAFSVGDDLYLSAATAGAFTNVKPAQPNYAIKIGIVIRDHATEGVVLVNINQRTNNFSNIRGLTANSVLFANSNGFIDENAGVYTYDGTDERIKADNARRYWGAGDDVASYYDGSDFWLLLNVVAASDFKINCGTNKTVELQETVWDDLRVPASSARVQGATGVPDFAKLADDGAGSNGVYTFFFDDSTDEQVFFSVQIPHKYKEGTDLKPHVHWAPQTTSTGTVTWKLEYTIADFNGTFGNTSTITMQDPGDGTINKHQKTASGTIDGSGCGISCMLICRLYRDVSDGDDFVGDAALLEVDFHFEIDTIGSRQESTK